MRIVNQQQQDTLAHRRSSPIRLAEGLEDPLLMAHGMVDVTVYVQDIVRLAPRCIEFGMPGWELAVRPVEDHGVLPPDSWADEFRRFVERFEARLARPQGAGSGGKR